MPVTKTAKRALRGSKAKQLVNNFIVAKLEAAIRQAKKSKSAEKIRSAISLADRAVKKRVIHKNKAARIKSQMSKLTAETKKTAKITKTTKKSLSKK